MLTIHSSEFGFNEVVVIEPPDYGLSKFFHNTFGITRTVPIKSNSSLTVQFFKIISLSALNTRDIYRSGNNLRRRQEGGVDWAVSTGLTTVNQQIDDCTQHMRVLHFIYFRFCTMRWEGQTNVRGRRAVVLGGGRRKSGRARGKLASTTIGDFH